jgi:NADH:ubiquinone oxidoreductase subunit 6 (subunit J)
MLIAVLTLAGAVAAMTLPNLVHCALALAVAFGGLATLYLLLDAQFIGLAQILVYVGAVAILIVFAILLTRGSAPDGRSRFASGWAAGVVIATVVFGVLAGAILSSRGLAREFVAAPTLNVRHLGDLLMTRFVLPLEIVGLLLTTALIGAVIVALREKEAR